MLRKDKRKEITRELSIELKQSKDEGKDTSMVEERVKAILTADLDDQNFEKKAEGIIKEIEFLPKRENYLYIEPSDLENIRNCRTPQKESMKLNNDRLSDEILFDKIYGAWLGRCAGCLLGQPIEGWTRERITGLLKETDNYPFKYYISSDIGDELRTKYGVVDEGKVYGEKTINWINNVKYMPEDDDTNYTIMGLKILEEYGKNFTPDDVAESWLANLPIQHVCTAEKVAYRNLVNDIYPPDSASFRNPYREWIGAQIRADFFGYITPGNPELGAEMAWRDASISHIKNGIYGEMFAAAMLSASAVESDIYEIINQGIYQIPEKSRLAEEVRNVINWKKKEGILWEQAIDRIHAKYDETDPHDWCHTIPNAMLVCVGLIYGELDFEKSIGIAVLGAFDTDCNGATVGSIMGMILGAKKLPQKWIKPLNNQIKSGVDGFGLVKISDMAQRTVEVMKSLI
jgi:ADP-ribosylglycohydrolase